MFRDITIYDEDIPYSWDVFLTRNGLVEDLTGPTITAKLLDDGVEIGVLPIDTCDAHPGVVRLGTSSTLVHRS